MTSLGSPPPPPTPPPPPPPDPRLATAIGALNAGDVRGAAQTLSVILATRPDDAQAHHLQGQAMARMQRFGEAERHLRRAAELEPRNVAYLHWLAGLLDRNRDYAGSLALYNRIRALSPENPEPHADAAALCEMLGRFDEAREASRAALAINPMHERARLSLIKVDLRETTPDDATLRRWRAELEPIARSTNPHLAAAALEMLVEVCEKLGEYSVAFGHIAAINRLDADARRQLVPPPALREAYLRMTSDLARGLTPERTARWKGELPEDAGPAPALLVGFPRSGTTMTERALGAHPRVRSIEELFTFETVKAMLPRVVGAEAMRARPLSEVIDGLAPAQVMGLREAYWAQARGALGEIGGDDVVLDKMPLRIAELAFVNRVFPDARVIVALRDPRDVCLSCFRQRFDFVNNAPMSFFLDLGDTARLYAHVMSLWLEHRGSYSFPWMEIRYEETVTDFESRTRRIIDFLGLAWDDAVLSFHESTGRRASTTPSYHAVRQRVYTRAVGRWRRYEEGLAPILPTLAPLVGALGYEDGPEAGDGANG